MESCYYNLDKSSGQSRTAVLTFKGRSETMMTGIPSEFMQRLKHTGIDNNEWDHPDFVKDRKNKKVELDKKLFVTEN
jgi:hypothetical protein